MCAAFLGEKIRNILLKSKNIAIVGLSADAKRPSNMVARYLKDHGYKIIPVNPSATEILSEKCYPDLKSVPERVDIVNVFRNSADVPPIVADAIDINAKCIWLQLGVSNVAAEAAAEQRGIIVISNKCIKIEH